MLWSPAVNALQPQFPPGGRCVTALIRWMAGARGALLLTALAGAHSSAHAQQVIAEVKLFEEEEITIKAPTKMELPISKAPGSVTVITAQQIRESGARTIPELLRLVAGVNIRWNPMVQTIDMRGFGENPFTSRVLLMIDDVPYNAWDKGGFPQHPSFDFFVLQNIKRIEVMRGPGSALYGENAYWGVINIVTLSGEDLQGARTEIFAGERVTGSVGTYYGQRFDAGSIFASGKFVHSQLPMAFWAEENDSRVKAFDGFLKATYRDLQLSYYRHDDAMDGFSELVPDPSLPPGSVFRSADDVSQSINIVAAKFDRALRGGGLSLAGHVSYARRDGTHCAACHGVHEKREFRERENHGFQLIGDFRVGVNLIPSHTLLLGVEGRRIDAGDHVHELGVPLGSSDRLVSAYWKPAVYVQDQVSLAGDRVRLTGGLRFDGDTKLFDNKVSPRVAAVWNPTGRLVLRTGWSTAFRFPNFSELYQNSWFFNVATPFGAFPFAVFAPNPGLKPERIRTVEAGAEYHFSPNLSAKLDLYRSRLADFMVITQALLPPPDPSPVRYENHPDEAVIIGSELELRWNAARRVTGVVNWSHQTEDQDGGLTDSTGTLMEFTYAADHKFNVGAYFGPFGRVRGALEVQWKSDYVAPAFWYLVRSNFTDPTIRSLDGYALVNLRLNYDLPPFGGAAGVPVRLSVYMKNLLNERPEETLTGVDTRLAGREFFGGLTFGF